MSGLACTLCLEAGKLVVLWPWVGVLLPLPWLVWRGLPPVRPVSRAALRVPFYARDIEVGAAVAGDTDTAAPDTLRDMAQSDTTLSAPRVRPVRAGAIWVLLVLAAARPVWWGAGGVDSLLPWPLGLALLLALMEAGFVARGLSRRTARRAWPPGPVRRGVSAAVAPRRDNETPKGE